MPTTLALPKTLFLQIEERARTNGTSVDAEAAELLARALADDAREAELLAEIRNERQEMADRGVFITDDFINEAKNWGRS
jgi:hypothetical protein